MRAATAASLLLSLTVLLDGGANSVADAGDGEDCPVVPGLSLQVRLNNGVTVPRIGFGTAGLGHATEEAVSLALTAGYRHIDTAQAEEWYREEAVGRAIRRTTSAESKKPSPDRGVEQGESAGLGGRALPSSMLSREDIFVTTKIHPRDYGPGRLGAMMDTSNVNLQGIDLVLLHSPFCWRGSCPDNPTPWQDGWRELERLYSTGAVRAIGVSNFSEGLLRELLLIATVVPAAVQNWMDPFHQDRAVRALCAENGIAYIAYSTLGGQWAYRPSSASSSSNPVSADPTLGAIAAAHGESAQTVALSWALQSGAIILPRSSKGDRISGNLRSFVKQEAGGTATYPSYATAAATAAAAAAAAEEEERSSTTDGDEASDGTMVRGCRLAGEARGDGGGWVDVFLTEEEMEAINRLDGTMES